MSYVELHPYQSIGCADYEYIEIACMDRYIVDLVTNTGTLEGLAVTTQTTPRGEFLLIQRHDGTQESVRVDRIQKMTVLSENRRFDERIFAATASKK